MKPSESQSSSFLIVVAHPDGHCRFNRCPFLIVKFRSTARNTSSITSSEIVAPAITRTGRVIRRLNIDELPQLANILASDMSLVDPRPALPSQRERVDRRVRRADYVSWRHSDHCSHSAI